MFAGSQHEDRLMVTTSTPTPPSPETAAWHEALDRRRTVERADRLERDPGNRELSRRRFIARSFWTGLGVALVGTLAGAVDYLYPRNVRGFGGPFAAGNVAEIPRGAPPREFRNGQFWLVNLDPAETRPGGAGGGVGLLALWRRCPHLGCAVPWNPTFDFDGDGGGWFRCPCHQSTYTKAGVRVHGPAPRSMDTMLIEIDEAGEITVQTGERQNGGDDNPSRAVGHPLLPT
jgi:cytochrome b6-f complex iron-sulfur subunit